MHGDLVGLEPILYSLRFNYTTTAATSVILLLAMQLSEKSFFSCDASIVLKASSVHGLETTRCCKLKINLQPVVFHI